MWFLGSSRETQPGACCGESRPSGSSRRAVSLLTRQLGRTQPLARRAGPGDRRYQAAGEQRGFQRQRPVWSLCRLIRVAVVSQRSVPGHGRSDGHRCRRGARAGVCHWPADTARGAQRWEAGGGFHYVGLESRGLGGGRSSSPLARGGLPLSPAAPGPCRGWGWLCPSTRIGT